MGSTPVNWRTTQFTVQDVFVCSTWTASHMGSTGTGSSLLILLRVDIGFMLTIVLQSFTISVPTPYGGG